MTNELIKIMTFKYKIGERVPEEKLGVVQRYCNNNVSCATIVGYDSSGSFMYYDVEVQLKSKIKTIISIPIDDLNK